MTKAKEEHRPGKLGRDFDSYMHHLDGYDLSHEEKMELIKSIYHMMEHFVDAAWGQTSEQIILRERGRASKAASSAPESRRATAKRKPKKEGRHG